MTNHVVNLTADVSKVLSFFESLEDILEISDTGLELLNSFPEILSLEVKRDAASTTGDCCVVFDISDSFRSFISALRAGNI